MVRFRYPCFALPRHRTINSAKREFCPFGGFDGPLLGRRLTILPDGWHIFVSATLKCIAMERYYA